MSMATEVEAFCWQIPNIEQDLAPTRREKVRRMEQQQQEEEEEAEQQPEAVRVSYWEELCEECRATSSGSSTTEHGFEIRAKQGPSYHAAAVASLASARFKLLEKKLHMTEERERRLQVRAEFLSTWHPVVMSPGCTDILLHAGGHIFRAHKSVLAAHSQVFLQKLKKLEAESMGDKDMSIEVHVEPDSLDSFIRYMYTGNVSPREMTIHATKLLKAARRYSVGALQMLAEHHIAKSVTCETALSTWELGSDHSSEIIKKAVIDTLLSQHDMKQVLHLSEYPTYRTQKKSADLLVALFENLFSKTLTSTTATATATATTV